MPAVRPKPSVLVTIVAATVIAACVAMAVGGVAVLANPETPGGFMGAVIVVPSCLVLAATQFLAVFRASRSASNFTTVICFGVGALFASSLIEYFRPPDNKPEGSGWVLLIMLALATGATFVGEVNRRWGKVIAMAPPTGQCLTCGYDLTGNVSGVCPECGNARADRTLLARRGRGRLV